MTRFYSTESLSYRESRAVKVLWQAVWGLADVFSLLDNDSFAVRAIVGRTGGLPVGLAVKQQRRNFQHADNNWPIRWAVAHPRPRRP
jgi:hypothetical protein